MSIQPSESLPTAAIRAGDAQVIPLVPPDPSDIGPAATPEEIAATAEALGQRALELATDLEPTEESEGYETLERRKLTLQIGAEMLFQASLWLEGMEKIEADAERVLIPSRGADRPMPESTAVPFDLTRREMEMLEHVATGKSNGEIARLEWVTEQTVKFHLSNVYRKLDVSNRTEASSVARAHGLVSSPQDMSLPRAERSVKYIGALDALFFIVKDSVDIPYTLRELGGLVYSAEKTTTRSAQKVGSLLNSPRFDQKIDEAGLYIEKQPASEENGHPNLRAGTVVLICRRRNQDT